LTTFRKIVSQKLKHIFMQKMKRYFREKSGV
jgi:hypothetical protein